MKSFVSFFASARLMNGCSDRDVALAERAGERAAHLLVEDHAARRREDELLAAPVLDRILEIDRARVDARG